MITPRFRGASFMLRAALCALLSLGTLGQTVQAQSNEPVSVLTQHNDNLRTGLNPNETVLNTSNVNVNTFGKLFTVPLDGYLFAQPLYVSGVTIGGGVHNVVYVATAHDSVYAIDADSGVIYWKISLGTAVPSSVIGTQNILVEVGIISTPVIDPSTNTIFVVAKTYENNLQIFRLHALDLVTGTEKLGGPAILSANVTGSGDNSDGTGHVPFIPSEENQRAALTLANGNVYMAFASHEDIAPTHGWVLAYNTQTLQQTAVWCATPNGTVGSIWQSGQGGITDASGNLYFVVSNGTSSAQSGGSDFGESFVKLSPSLVLQDFMLVNNYTYLTGNDVDLGSGGPIGIPGTNLIYGMGKQGLGYLVNTDPTAQSDLLNPSISVLGMGGFHASDDAVRQKLYVGSAAFGGAAYYNNNIYMWPVGDNLKAFAFANGQLSSNPSMNAASKTGSNGDPTGSISISSNGTVAGSAILWATQPLADPDHTTVSGELFAYDATDLTHVLWTSLQNSARDDYGAVAKFDAPTIANGKVYVPTDAKALVVYGILNAQTTPAGLTATPGSAQVTLIWAAFSGATSYNVYRGTAAGAEGTTPIMTGVTGKTFLDNTVTNGTTYYYEITAVTSSGETGKSNEASATPAPLPAPAAPANLTANAGDRFNSLTWSAVSAATSYNVYRSTASESEGNTPIQTGVTGTTFTDTGLTNGTTYYYQVTAVNTNGESAKSSEASATPAAATGQTIGINFVGGSGNVTVMPMGTSETAGVVPTTNWNNAAGSSGTSNWLRDGTGAATGACAAWSSDAGGFLPITETAGNVRMMRGYLDTPTGGDNVTVSVTGLSSNYTANGYDIYVYCDGDNGGESRKATYTVGTSSIGLQDNANTNFSGAFVQANNSSGNYVVFGNQTAASFTLRSIPGAAASGTYRAPVNAIEIVAHASAGSGGIAPTAPTNLGATGGNASVALSWTASTGAATYNVYRSTTTGGETVLVTGVTATTYTDTTAANGTTYYYEVTAVNASGESAKSNEASATPMAPPAATGGNAISVDFVGGSTSMAPTENAGVTPEAFWNNATGSSGSLSSLVDDSGTGSGASVSWASDATGALLIANTAGNARMMQGYLDTPYGSDSTYVSISGLSSIYTSNGYDVYVYCDGNNNRNTRDAAYKIGSTTIQMTDATYADFSGAFVQANNSAGNYVVFVNQTASSFSLTATPGFASDGTPRAAVNGIQVVAHSAPSGGVNGTVPAAPTKLSATGGNASVALSWTASTGAATYNVYRSTTTGGETVLVTGVTATTYTDTTAANGTTYYYEVTAVNASGESAKSNEASATPMAPPAATGGNAISIDFVGGSTSMAPTENAGVTPEAFWNNATGSSGSLSSLLDDSGAGSGASVSWASDATGALLIANTAGNARMMQGYLDTPYGWDTTNVSISGLSSIYTSNGYDIYVYCDGNNNRNTRDAAYKIGSMTIQMTDAAYADYGGTFAQANNSAGNYIVFANQTASSFSLTATPGFASDGTPRAAVNGIQIVAHSAP